MKWNAAGIALWIVLFAVAIAYEAWCGLDHAARTPMLTQVVVRYVPWPFTIGFILWLLVHFSVRYANPAYRAFLNAGGL